MNSYHALSPALQAVEIIKLDIRSILPNKHYFDDNEVFSIAVDNFMRYSSDDFDESWIRSNLAEIFQLAIYKDEPHLLSTKREVSIVLSRLRDRITQFVIMRVRSKLTHQEISNLFEAIDLRYYDLVARRVPLTYLAKFGLPVVSNFQTLEERKEVALLEDTLRAMIPGVNSEIHSVGCWGRAFTIAQKSVTFPSVFDELRIGERYLFSDQDDANPFISGSVVFLADDGWRTVHLSVFQEVDNPDTSKETQLFAIDRNLIIVHNAAVEIYLDEKFYSELYAVNELPEYENHWEDIDLCRIGRFTCNLVVTRDGRLSLLGTPVKTFDFTSNASHTIELRKAIVETIERKTSKINGM